MPVIYLVVLVGVDSSRAYGHDTKACSPHPSRHGRTASGDERRRGEHAPPGPAGRPWLTRPSCGPPQFDR